MAMIGEYSSTGVFRLPPRERGAVLVIGLLILLVMTLIGVTAMSTSTMQERMSANGMNANIAFQAAESAVRAATSGITTAQSAMSSTGAVAGCSVLQADNSKAGNNSSAIIKHCMMA